MVDQISVLLAACSVLKQGLQGDDSDLLRDIDEDEVEEANEEELSSEEERDCIDDAGESAAVKGGKGLRALGRGKLLLSWILRPDRC